MAEIIKDIGKYRCSHKRQHKEQIVLECEECKSKYERPSCWPKKQKTCSSWCAKRLYQRQYSGENNTRYKGGITAGGYKRVGSSNNRKLEHRVVMEGLLNRKLEKNEWVHHINGDKLDNRPENLIMVLPETHFSDIHCPNCKYHFLIK